MKIDKKYYIDALRKMAFSSKEIGFKVVSLQDIKRIINDPRSKKVQKNKVISGKLYTSICPYCYAKNVKFIASHASLVLKSCRHIKRFGKKKSSYTSFNYFRNDDDFLSPKVFPKIS